MFSYCNSNPVLYADPTGCAPVFPVCWGGIEYQRIHDQYEEPYGSMELGGYTVSYNGCGAVAAYNALLSLGNPKSFDDVLSYFNADASRLFFNGKFGILPHEIAAYFKSLGYTAIICVKDDTIEAASKTADACIMFYLFPRYDYGIPLPGAHYVEYVRYGNTYVGYNTDESGGITFFSSPTKYGQSDPKFEVIGVYIYKTD